MNHKSIEELVDKYIGGGKILVYKCGAYSTIV